MLCDFSHIIAFSEQKFIYFAQTINTLKNLAIRHDENRSRMHFVIDDMMRIMKSTSSMPVLAVIFESLFVFCHDRKSRNYLITQHNLLRSEVVEKHSSKDGLSKIIKDLRNLVDKLENTSM